MSNTHPRIAIEQYRVGTGDEQQTLWRVANLKPIKSGRMNSLEASIMPSDYPEATHDRQRLVVACGMGTDSVAMLLEMKRRGIRPDCIQWADTGSEHRHTYRYFNILQAWCERVGFPPIVVVRRRCPRAGHRSLYDQGWNTEQLPSAAFYTNHSCSIEWKLKPQRRYQALLPWLNTHGTILEAIGLDASEMNRKSVRYQINPEDGFAQWYPLAEWNLSRADLIAIIDKAGLPQPGKSACFMCPVSKLCELHAMQDNEPNELQAALALESRFGKAQEKRNGKYKGLRKMQTWAHWIASNEESIKGIGLEATPLADPTING